MLHLDLHTLPRDFSKLQARLDEIAQRPEPVFATYVPDFQLLYTLAGKYAATSNFILIGRGGSVSGFRALFNALARYHTTKRVHIVDTLDPDYLSYVRSKCPPAETLVLVISKSGTTIEVFENLLCFQEYKKVIITQGTENPLAKVAEMKEIERVEHPSIGGRFSTGTECALLPGALIYVDVKSISDGMRAVCKQCAPSQPIARNPALQLAAALCLAEEEGLTEVYAPIYSKPLAGSAELWTQLLHESVCKGGKGQTFLFQEAPECQHHTLQKFMDGPRRMAGLFTRVEQPDHDCPLSLTSSGLSGLTVRELPLRLLDGEHLGDSLLHEYTGSRKAADEATIPNATITLDTLNPGTFGELTAFWMYVAVYSAWLRGLDAFDQPGVEASKRLAIEERKSSLPDG